MIEDYPEKCNNCSYWSKCLQKYEISEYEECRDYKDSVASGCATIVYGLIILIALSVLIFILI